MQEENYSFKFVICGESSIGKSSLLLRFADNTFSQSFLPTIGVDFKFLRIKSGQNTIKLQIWDTAGQQRFKTITASYYKGADGVILAYDISNRHTFVNLQYWRQQIKKYANQDVNIILIALKNDLEPCMQVPSSEGEAFAKKYGMSFIQSSSKENINVQEAFHTLANDIISKRQKQNQEKTPNEQVKCQKIEEKIEEKKEEAIKEEEKRKFEGKGDKFYDFLTSQGVGDITIEILKSEQIKSLQDLKYLKEEELKELDIKLGEIARIRKIVSSLD